MAEVPAYCLKAAFMQAWRSAWARREIDRGGIVRAHLIDGMLVVTVHVMPPGAINPDFLRYGAAFGRRILTDTGAAYWNAVSQLGLQEARRLDPGAIVGLIIQDHAYRVEAERLGILEPEVAA